MVINSLSASSQVNAIDVTDDENFGLLLESNSCVSSSISKFGVAKSKSSQRIDYMTLSKKWGISPEKAKHTIQRTTQRGIRTVLHPSLSRRFRTNDQALRYRRLPHPVFGDTLIAGTTSLQGNKYAQHDGVPPACIVDGSKEQVKGEFRCKLKEASCRLKQTEPYSPWQNAAEGNIRELKKGAGRMMIKSGSPKRLWDDCLVLESYIQSNTAHDIFMLSGEVPETIMSGETSDISQFCEFEWYERVKFRDDAIQFPDDSLVLERYLGPSIDVGPALTAKILKQNGEVVHRSTYRGLTPEEIANPIEQAAMKNFDETIQAKLGPKTSIDDFKDLGIDESPILDKYEDDDHDGRIPDPPDEELDATPEIGDNYVNTEVMLPRGDHMARGKVIRRKRDAEGNPIGRANNNPILDTRQYEVQFADGEVTELTANVIAEVMFAQCDEDGNEYVLFDSFVDFQKDGTALSMADQKVVVKGRPFLRRTTVGWQFCCQWKDGSTSWEKLSDLKESHPVQAAEYAVAQGIDREPAFNWWVPHVLKKRDSIIAQVKHRSARYLKRTHKWGLEVPQLVDDALAIDKRNGNTLWADAIAKEMKNVRVAFKILENGEKTPPGFQFIRCHMIFDIKMEDFRRKA
eukprot:CCRYP_003177-RA/>CCRYP_003177-RA protein AED:0.23 eAED:0.23 QI:0/0/0/1/1/1/2/0/629